jgi:hypothetical protein
MERGKTRPRLNTDDVMREMSRFFCAQSILVDQCPARNR